MSDSKIQLQSYSTTPTEDVVDEDDVMEGMTSNLIEQEPEQPRQKRYGTTFTAKQWLSLDPCGLLCAWLVILLHIFSWGILFDSMVGSSIAAKIIMYGCYTPCVLLALYSHYLTWTTDPGAVSMGAKPYEDLTKFCRPASSGRSGSDENRNVSESRLMSAGESSYSSNDYKNDSISLSLTYSQRFPRGVRRCKKCNGNFKPPRAHHDSVTGRCIVKLDHYCPWVGNAIGIRNHKVFLLFIFYTFLATCFAGILIIMRFSKCGFDFDDEDTDDIVNDDPRTNVVNENSVGYIQVSRLLDAVYPGCDNEDANPLFFQGEVLTEMILNVCAFLFTLIMTFDQYEAVTLSISKIARMKIDMTDDNSEVSDLHRVSETFNEVFGGSSNSFELHWLVPTLVKFPEDQYDKLMGYEIDPDAKDRNQPWRFEKESSKIRRKISLRKLNNSETLSFPSIHSKIGSQLNSLNAEGESKDSELNRKGDIGNPQDDSNSIKSSLVVSGHGLESIEDL